MKALLVIDAQNGITNAKNFTDELHLIEEIIQDFKRRDEPVIFIKQIDEFAESPLYKNSPGSDIRSSLAVYANTIIEKKTPSSFFQTKLSDVLTDLKVNHLFITGFQTEFCCMFTAIAAFDRGYKVTFIENATGTVNDGETYKMGDLDIRDFVGTVLHWSDVIEVLDYDEYIETYNKDHLYNK